MPVACSAYKTALRASTQHKSTSVAFSLRRRAEGSISKRNIELGVLHPRLHEGDLWLFA